MFALAIKENPGISIIVPRSFIALRKLLKNSNKKKKKKKKRKKKREKK
jgi:hypothetical protein